MPAPAGYVEFTVIQRPVIQYCVNAYTPAAAPGQPAPPQQPMGTKEIFDKAKTWVQQSQPGAPPVRPPPPPAYAEGFSFFELIIQLNNLNGAKPIPAGHVIVAHIMSQSSKIVPCNTPPPRAFVQDYYEKFDATGIDFQALVTQCKSTYCARRVIDYAIIPDPAPATAIPAGEYVLIFKPDPQQIMAFNGAITLRVTITWDYDNCSQPRKSVVTFNAEMLDPAQGGRVIRSTPGGPLSYSAP